MRKKLSNHTGKQQMRTVLNKFSRVVLHQITVEEVTAFFIKKKLAPKKKLPAL